MVIESSKVVIEKSKTRPRRDVPAIPLPAPTDM